MTRYELAYALALSYIPGHEIGAMCFASAVVAHPELAVTYDSYVLYQRGII
jgi:hypothetical protein